MNTDQGMQVAYWQGELLWPQPLEDAAVIDLSAVTALGTWVYPWFRQRPQRAVVAASAAIKGQLTLARLPILWYPSQQRLQALGGHNRPHTGVGPDERALLWGDNDGR